MKPKHFGRYKDLGLLLSRYGLKDFQLTLKPADVMVVDDEDKPLEPDVKARAEAFAASLKEMGPTFIKFGQLLSTRPDIVPKEYVTALESLQDQVEPFSFGEVEKIIESELNVRISKAFESFDAKPLAAASLGQVHRATLRDGRQVVVKVQRPDIREIIEKDLDVFAEIAAFLERHSGIGKKMNLVETLAQMRRTLLAELNYLQEAHNTETLRGNLAEFKEIYIPAVIHDMSTTKVLTTELIKGQKVSKITPLGLIDHDYAALAAVVVHAYLKQVCVDGFFHSDPHPGNVFVQEDRLVLLDFGMVSRISHEFQDEVVKLLLGVTDNRGVEVAEVCMRVGNPQPGFDRDVFVRDITTMVNTFYDVQVQQVNVGQLMFNVIGVANGDNLQVPSELAMLAKTLLHLDSITRKLDPDFNPRDVIHDYSEKLVAKKVQQKFHPRNFYTPLLDLNQLILELPRRSLEIVNQTSSGKLTFNHKLVQADDFLKGMHKIANRITVGLVIAALIVGSSLMMRVPSRVAIFGYPAIGMLGYLAASLIGLYLVISILLQDRSDRTKARKKTDYS